MKRINAAYNRTKDSSRRAEYNDEFQVQALKEMQRSFDKMVMQAAALRREIVFGKRKW